MNELMNQKQQQQQQQQHHLMNLNQQNLMGMNQMNPQSQTQILPMNRGYAMWPQQPPLSFQKLNLNPNPGSMKPTLSSSFHKQLGPRNNWKGKMINKPNEKRRNEQQNRMKTRKFFPKKKFNNNNTSMNMNLNLIANKHNFNNSRSAPFAPRNTTSCCFSLVAYNARLLN